MRSDPHVTRPAESLTTSFREAGGRIVVRLERQQDDPPADLLDIVARRGAALREAALYRARRTGTNPVVIRLADFLEQPDETD